MDEDKTTVKVAVLGLSDGQARMLRGLTQIVSGSRLRSDRVYADQVDEMLRSQGVGAADYTIDKDGSLYMPEWEKAAE